MSNAMKCLLAIAALVFAYAPMPSAAAVKVQEVKAAGVTAWLAEDHHVPVIEVRILFTGAGYVSDPAAKQGRAALAASLLSEGAGERDSKQFQRALEEKAISLDAGIGRDHLEVSLQTLSEHRDDAFALLADALLRPRFDGASMKEVKRRFEIKRIKRQESPYYLAYRAFDDAAYAQHPYAQEAIGSPQSIAALTREDLSTYRQAYLSKANMLISVAGAITPAQLKKLLTNTFKKLPAEYAPEHKVQDAAFPTEPFSVSISKQLPQTVWLFAREGIARDDPDFYAAYVLNHIMGGGSSLTSRLGEEVRKKRGLSYGISLSLQQDVHATRWLGTVATQNETAAQAKQVIEETFAKAASEGISEDELRKAKDYLKGSFPLSLASNAGVASYLTSMQLYGLGRDYLQKRNDLFEAVTLQQVNALVKPYFAPDKWSWVRVGQEAEAQEEE